MLPAYQRREWLDVIRHTPNAFGFALAFMAITAPLFAEDLNIGLCDPPLQTFEAALLQAELVMENSGSSFLSADIVNDPNNECRAIWVLELLTHEDDVELLILDAQTLETRDELPDYFLAILERPSYSPGSSDMRPVRIDVVGTAERDLLEGEWSDDASFGGHGADTFLLTPGRDVILDFNPLEDTINLTNFVFADFGFPTLTTFEEVVRAAKPVQRNEQSGTEIDIDGDAGDWSVFLPGVEISHLSRANVVFPDTGERSDAPIFQAERRVTVSDGSIVVIPGHNLHDQRVEPYLFEGSTEALALVRRLFYFDEFRQDEM